MTMCKMLQLIRGELTPERALRGALLAVMGVWLLLADMTELYYRVLISLSLALLMEGWGQVI